MKKIIFLCINVFVLLCYNYSQLNADSLKKVILQMPNDTASIYKILKIGRNIEKTDFKLSLDIYKLAEEKYGDNIYDSTEGAIYTLLANSYTWQDDANQAMKYFLKTKDIGERLKNNGFIATGYSGIALVYHLNKDFVTAIENYEKAMPFYTNDYDKSHEYIVANVGNLGYAYYQQSQTIDTSIKSNLALYNTTLQKAIFNNKLSLELALQPLTDSTGMAKATINLCLEYVAFGNIDSAHYYYNFSSKLLLHVKNQDAHCEHFYNKGQIAFFKKEYKAALAAYNSSLLIAQKITYQEYIYENYYSIHLCNLRLGNFKAAFIFYKKYASLKDSLLTRSKIIEGTNLKNKYLNDVFIVASCSIIHDLDDFRNIGSHNRRTSHVPT